MPSLLDLIEQYYSSGAVPQGAIGLQEALGAVVPEVSPQTIAERVARFTGQAVPSVAAGIGAEALTGGLATVPLLARAAIGGAAAGAVGSAVPGAPGPVTGAAIGAGASFALGGLGRILAQVVGRSKAAQLIKEEAVKAGMSFDEGLAAAGLPGPEFTPGASPFGAGGGATALETLSAAERLAIPPARQLGLFGEAIQPPSLADDLRAAVSGNTAAFRRTAANLGATPEEVSLLVSQNAAGRAVTRAANYTTELEKLNTRVPTPPVPELAAPPTAPAEVLALLENLKTSIKTGVKAAPQVSEAEAARIASKELLNRQLVASMGERVGGVGGPEAAAAAQKSLTKVLESADDATRALLEETVEDLNPENIARFAAHLSNLRCLR